MIFGELRRLVEEYPVETLVLTIVVLMARRVIDLVTAVLQKLAVISFLVAGTCAVIIFSIKNTMGDKAASYIYDRLLTSLGLPLATGLA